MEEYLESELSGIFRVKLVTKNKERGSPGTQFMHMRANSEKMCLTVLEIRKIGDNTYNKETSKLT